VKRRRTSVPSAEFEFTIPVFKPPVYHIFWLNTCNDQIKDGGMERNVSRMKKKAHKILSEKLEGKRLIGGSRCRYVYSIRPAKVDCVFD
jgi:hypothetical protein